MLDSHLCKRGNFTQNMYEISRFALHFGLVLNIAGH